MAPWLCLPVGLKWPGKGLQNTAARYKEMMFHGSQVLIQIKTLVMQFSVP